MIYSYNIKYDLPKYERDESKPITFQQYLANMTAKMGKYAGDQLLHAMSCDNNPTTEYFMYLTRHKVNQPKSSTGYPVFSMKSYSSNPTISLTDQVLSKPL